MGRSQDERARRESPRALLFSLPVREDALGWLPASCVCITSGSGLNQKCPNMLLKRTRSTCSGGWTVLGVLYCPRIDDLSSATGRLQPPLQHLSPSWKKDLALLNTQTEHFCGCFRARIHPENFAGGLEKQTEILK